MKGLTLARLRNTDFNLLYKKLVLKERLTEGESQKILSLAIIFINEKNKDISKLGYRILVFYCNQINNYQPLYDIALNEGLIPVVKLIEKINYENARFKNSFFANFFSSYTENYKENEI